MHKMYIIGRNWSLGDACLFMRLPEDKGLKLPAEQEEPNGRDPLE